MNFQHTIIIFLITGEASGATDAEIFITRIKK